MLFFTIEHVATIDLFLRVKYKYEDYCMHMYFFIHKYYTVCVIDKISSAVQNLLSYHFMRFGFSRTDAIYQLSVSYYRFLIMKCCFFIIENHGI